MIQHIGVVGAGQMGAGIALVAAWAKFQVHVYEPWEQARQKAKHYFEKKLQTTSIDSQNENGGKIQFCERLGQLAHCDLFIEAIPEQESLKIELFKTLDQISHP